MVLFIEEVGKGPIKLKGLGIKIFFVLFCSVEFIFGIGLFEEVFFFEGN